MNIIFSSQPDAKLCTQFSIPLRNDINLILFFIYIFQIVSRNTGDARFHRECFDSIKKEFEKWQISTSDPKRAKTTSSDTAFSKNTSSESPDADTNGRRYSRRIKSKQQKVQSEVGSVKGFLATGGIDPIAFQRERNAFLQSLETAEFTDRSFKNYQSLLIYVVESILLCYLTYSFAWPQLFPLIVPVGQYLEI